MASLKLLNLCFMHGSTILRSKLLRRYSHAFIQPPLSPPLVSPHMKKYPVIIAGYYGRN